MYKTKGEENEKRPKSSQKNVGVNFERSSNWHPGDVANNNY